MHFMLVFRHFHWCCLLKKNVKILLDTSNYFLIKIYLFFHCVFANNHQMQSWAESKQQPGQFTGSTGAQIMSQAELAPGFQAWARKVHFPPSFTHFSLFLFCFGDQRKQSIFCFANPQRRLSRIFR